MAPSLSTDNPECMAGLAQALNPPARLGPPMSSHVFLQPLLNALLSIHQKHTHTHILLMSSFKGDKKCSYHGSRCHHTMSSVLSARHWARWLSISSWVSLQGRGQSP